MGFLLGRIVVQTKQVGQDGQVMTHYEPRLITPLGYKNQLCCSAIVVHMGLVYWFEKISLF